MLRVESEVGDIVLDLIDEEEWVDERAHLLALQAKLNSYLAFV